ncbi:MAG: hypothetical protein ABL940_14020, partial [Bacteroidia bacterium]
FMYEFKVHKLTFVNMFVIAYIAVVALFPFGNTGFRLLLPLYVISFYYAIIALKKVLVPFEFNFKIATIVIGTLVLLPSKQLIEVALSNQDKLIDGPCTPASYELFNIVNASTTASDVVVFEKPRALALYTHVQALALRNNLTTQELTTQLKQYKVKYLLLNNTLVNDALSNYVKTESVHCELIFTNTDYQFYKLLF